MVWARLLVSFCVLFYFAFWVLFSFCILLSGMLGPLVLVFLGDSFFWIFGVVLGVTVFYLFIMVCLCSFLLGLVSCLLSFLDLASCLLSFLGLVSCLLSFRASISATWREISHWCMFHFFGYAAAADIFWRCYFFSLQLLLLLGCYSSSAD